VHAAASAARATGSPAKQLGNKLAGRQPLRQGMTMPAMGAEDHVIGSQMSANPGGNGFLAHVGMAGSVDQAPLVRAGQIFLALANQLHLPVQPQQEVLIQFGLNNARHISAFWLVSP
jgi:hypothetical protein